MANSLKEKSLTILLFPMPSDVRGNPEKTPSATPYEPSLSIAALKTSPDLVGFSTDETVSHAARAADEADEAPRDFIISAPLC